MSTAKGGTGFGHERGFMGATNDWLTPKFITNALGPFDLDPCAAPMPRPWDIARHNISLPENGLALKWENYGRVFCNPPYGPDTARWMRKMGDHNYGIALIFARVETKAWQEWVWPFAEGVLFLAGRLSFCKPDGKIGATAGAPSALVAFSPADAECLRLCSLPGVLVNAVGRYIEQPEEVPQKTLTQGEDWAWSKIFGHYTDDGWSDEAAAYYAWLEMQNEHPHLLGYKFKAEVHP
jgi:hypothetical protein